MKTVDFRMQNFILRKKKNLPSVPAQPQNYEFGMENRKDSVKKKLKNF